MIADKIDFLIKNIITQKGLDKDMILHTYLSLLDKSIIAGNLFKCRYKAKLKEFDNYGTACFDCT